MPSLGTRLYARARFTILNANILSLIRIAVRDCHSILDVGCGFGLLGCYLAHFAPDLTYLGIELDDSRVRVAQNLSQRLRLPQVTFRRGDARDLPVQGSTFDAVLMVDLLHHVADSTKEDLLRTSRAILADHGLLIVKDVDTRPAAKLLFTWLMDVAVARTFRMSYWSETRLSQAATSVGFRVDRYPVVDILPYPHTLVVAKKLGETDPERYPSSTTSSPNT